LLAPDLGERSCRSVYACEKTARDIIGGGAHLNARIVAPVQARCYFYHVEYLFAGFAVTRGPAFFLPSAG
jgi:hypothetical protein